MIGLFAAHVARSFEAAGPLLLWGLANASSKWKSGAFSLRAGGEASLVSRLLLLSVVARVAGVPASKVRLARGPFGKPVIEGAEDLHFSLAHGGEWAVLAIDVRPVGVDIERLRPVPHVGLSAAFSPSEIEDIERRDGLERSARLLELWTLKESYLKALGTGVAVPPDELSVSAPDGGVVEILQEGPVGLPAAPLRFRRYRLGGNHLVAACGQSDTFPPSIREVDPQALRAAALMLHIEGEAEDRRQRAEPARAATGRQGGALVSVTVDASNGVPPALRGAGGGFVARGRTPPVPCPRPAGAQRP
ncbi:MAG TPA: 4'-phosphopantetheinyl transferase superfamily protein [Candidatus Thermoplasmatota archaeon]